MKKIERVVRKPDTLALFTKRLEWPDLFATLKYKREFERNNPDYFKPDGILLFDGPQGSGKTLSAVKYVSELMQIYPDCIVCSNVILPEYDGTDRFVFFDSAEKFLTVRNGDRGVIFLVDEIHILFNSLASKNMDLSLFTAISQQRKQRIHIVGTSQLFMRVAKPFREQVKFAVMCNCVFGVLQFNKIVRGIDMEIDDDGNVKCKRLRRSWFFHSPKLYSLYDTLAVIDRVNFNFEM